jgi:hypothetical protein
MTGKQGSPESIVREIKRQTRRKFSAEEKIMIVLEGLRGEASISDLCRKEGKKRSVRWKDTRLTGFFLRVDGRLFPSELTSPVR